MLNRGVNDIYFYMCERQWIVPIIDHEFHVALLDQFTKSLQLALMDLVLVSVLDLEFVRVVFFDRDGAERIYSWFV